MRKASTVMLEQGTQAPSPAPDLIPAENERQNLTGNSHSNWYSKRGHFREAGLATADLCRQHGISEQTYYRWKAKYGGMETGDAKKLKQLEEENRKLKHVVADLTLDNRALKDVLSKNW